MAVPAQRKAGVTKAYDPEMGLKGFVRENGGEDFEEELRELEKFSELGRSYMKNLRGEVMRLGLICDREVYKSLGGALEKLDAAALEGMKAALEARAAEKLPLHTQLPGMADITRFDGGEYLI